MWRLLTKEEIEKLTEKQLSSYMEWLIDYKKQKLEELQEKKLKLDAINKRRDEVEIEQQEDAEEEEIQKIKQLLHQH